MAKRRQPIAVIEAKGKARYTKAVMEKRAREEIKAPPATGEPPSYLNAEQKKLYTYYAERLINLGIFSDIDEWTLACYCKAFTQWRKVMRLIEKQKLDPEDPSTMTTYKALNIEQNRWFSECERLGMDLGLNVSSRCKLVTPEKEEEPTNKFERFLKEG